MKLALDPKIEKQIRLAVSPGEPFALDELIEEICRDDTSLRGECSKIVADEYRRRLAAMTRGAMRELYRRHYKVETDANKDWLLGEIVESIEAQGN
jgi:hypothetical protein